MFASSCVHQTAHRTVLGRKLLILRWRATRPAPHSNHHHLQPTTSTTADRQQFVAARSYFASGLLLRHKDNGEPTSTYYDSQSGRHVPAPHPNEISLVLRGTSTTIPPQLYKQSNDGGTMLDDIRAWRQRGSTGLIVPPLRFPRDGRNLATLADIKPRGFRLFAYHNQPGGGGGSAAETALKKHDDVSVILEYSPTAPRDQFRNDLQDCVQQELHTTILLQHESLYNNCDDPILVASRVADCIDDAHGGGDCIWLAAEASPSTKSANDSDAADSAADAVVRLAEELSYLDLPGATVQSRLMVSATGGIQPEVIVVEEIMALGVNKFVVDDHGKNQQEHQMVEMVRQAAEEQGKSLVSVQQ